MDNPKEAIIKDMIIYNSREVIKKVCPMSSSPGLLELSMRASILPKRIIDASVFHIADVFRRSLQHVH